MRVTFNALIEVSYDVCTKLYYYCISLGIMIPKNIEQVRMI